MRNQEHDSSDPVYPAHRFAQNATSHLSLPAKPSLAASVSPASILILKPSSLDEHIEVGHRFPSVKLNTTYSFGLDDQEWVVAFESDKPEDFLDLVMALRETEGSRYTLRDTPIFTCIRKSLKETLDTLGG